jgi:hypothetical protein
VAFTLSGCRPSAGRPGDARGNIDAGCGEVEPEGAKSSTATEIQAHESAATIGFAVRISRVADATNHFTGRIDDVAANASAFSARAGGPAARTNGLAELTSASQALSHASKTPSTSSPIVPLPAKPATSTSRLRMSPLCRRRPTSRL